MQKISIIFIVISIIVILLCFSIFLFPSIFIQLNTYLSNFSNIISYFGMIFGAFAILVANLAYKAAILRPKLKLNLRTIKIGNSEGYILVDSNTKTVPNLPLTHNVTLFMSLENHGEVSAKCPMVQFIFKNSHFPHDLFNGWKSFLQANQVLSFGFQWSPGDEAILYPGIPVELPPMNFAGQVINIPFEIEITIVADGFKKNTYTYRVKTEFQGSEPT